jgi:hypothetical protein
MNKENELIDNRSYGFKHLRPTCGCWKKEGATRRNGVDQKLDEEEEITPGLIRTYNELHWSLCTCTCHKTAALEPVR